MFVKRPKRKIILVGIVTTFVALLLAFAFYFKSPQEPKLTYNGENFFFRFLVKYLHFASIK